MYAIKHLSYDYDDCLEDKREDYQNCSVLCCVRQLCTMIRAHIRAVFKGQLSETASDSPVVLFVGRCKAGVLRQMSRCAADVPL